MLLLGQGALLKAAAWVGLNEAEAIELNGLSVHQELLIKEAVLPDILKNEDFAHESAAGKAIGIRFYAGVPLRDRAGEFMGSSASWTANHASPAAPITRCWKN